MVDREIKEEYRADLSGVTIITDCKVGRTMRNRLVVLQTPQFGVIGLPVDLAEQLGRALVEKANEMKVERS